MSVFETLKSCAQKGEELYIYGAQHHAHCMCVALKLLVPEVKIRNFIVADRKNNPESIEGIAVKILQECRECARDIMILIATSEKYYAEIEETLNEAGFTNIINGTFGGVFDNEVRELYFKEMSVGRDAFVLLNEIPLPENPQSQELGMYMAKSVVDRPLQQAVNENAAYVIPVQAGAALTERKIAKYSDDEGENISCKNRNYCECTVTHYIWKHATEDYVGLCHYRRRFLWSAKDIELIRSGAVDVVLPCPVITVKGDYGIHYKPYVGEREYDTMLQVLKRNYPKYYQTAQEVMRGDLFYPCNMVLAKKEIYGDYAAWLFEVLSKVEAVCGDENVREDRYLGYLAEHLTTFYFVRHKKHMKVAHSRMEILK